MGEVFAGRYEVTEVLGTGGMGAVYRARDQELGRAVALKVMSDALSRDPLFRSRFRREASSAAAVDHPNVARIWHADVHDGELYVVMQLIEGSDLGHELDSQDRLELIRTVRLVGEAAAGLDAVHRVGLVHRDIKPGNILLDGETAYVTDFGLAKDSQASNLTRPGQALGSLDYMAPEQIRGEDVSAATDIYALGCMIHECLTGTPPFGGRPSMRVLFAHLQEEPPDLADAKIAPAVAKAINRAMEKEAEDRPASAAGYITAIAKAAGL
jgi:serine/threonine protein kinase